MKQQNGYLLQQEQPLSADDKSALCCVLCCGCSVLFVFIGIIIAYSVTGIIFLIYDWGKGGECADSNQVKSIYIYCCFSILWAARFVVPVQSSLRSVAGVDDTDNEEPTISKQEKTMIAGCVTNTCVTIMALPFAVTGLIILLRPLPCEQFQNMAIYKWARVTLYADITFVVYAILGIVVACYRMKNAAANDTNLLATSDISPAQTQAYPSMAAAFFPAKSDHQQPLLSSSASDNPLRIATTASTERSQDQTIQRSVLSGGTGADVHSQTIYSVCNHFGSSFHVQYRATHSEAKHVYDGLWGSKLMGCEGRVLYVQASSPMWESTLREYWNKVEERRQLRLNRGSLGIPPVPSDFGWSVCRHDGPSFNIFFFSEEAAARLCYNSSPFLSSRLLALDDTIVEKWAMTHSWDNTICQYWEVSIAVAVLKRSASNA
jgi:hypothetical protein